MNRRSFIQLILAACITPLIPVESDTECIDLIFYNDEIVIDQTRGTWAETIYRESQQKNRWGDYMGIVIHERKAGVNNSKGVL